MFVLDADHLVILQKRSGPDFANLLRRLTVLTRNTVDFQRIPNLSFEDWTVA
jgi:NAD(P)H-hydrate repair Nnr-like enzyme with NAD(P)H-hydrate dehydratase domain